MFNPSIHTVLIVDDDEMIRAFLIRLLSKQGYQVVAVKNGAEAMDYLDNHTPSLLILDIEMPVMDGLEVQKTMIAQNLSIPIIFITGFSSMDTTIKAIQRGAYDYLTKPFSTKSVIELTKRCLEDIASKGEAKQPSKAKPQRYELLGASHAMVDIYKNIGAVSRTENSTNVLILGESGTGKELVAHQIHMWSKHSDSPFIALNVTALPDKLVESELFGFEKGSFTSADKSSAGKFTLAQDGTIFLDEVGGLSLDLQQKLLRVLQEREYYRIGGNKTEKVKCRVIAASNENLEQLVLKGKFRNDLFYRLKVVQIVLPPLRERIEDIPILAQHFVNKYALEMARSAPRLPDETIEFLKNKEWPGNVRELENTIHRVMTITQRQSILSEDFAESSWEQPKVDSIPPHTDLETARQIVVDSFEREFITNGLKRAGGNITQAASEAGVSRQRFHQLLKKHDIDSNTFRS